MSKTKLKVGDRIRYTKSFLQSCGCYSGPSSPASTGPHARGLVLKITHYSNDRFSMAQIHWEDDRTTSVCASNLEACVSLPVLA